MLHILKSTCCFFFLYFLSLPIVVYSQEKQLQFELVDSTEIQFPELEKILAGPNAVKHYNNCIYILKLYNDTLHKIDLATGVHSVVVMDIRREMKRRFYPENFLIANDLIHLTNGYKIIRVDYSGKIIDKARLHRKQGNFVNISIPFLFASDEKEYILPIMPNLHLKKKDYENRSVKLLSYYQRNGLFGRFDYNGKLNGVFGTYDSIYFNGNHQNLDDYYASLTNNHVVTTQNIPSRIEVYSIQNRTSNFLDLPGKYIDSNFVTKSFSKNLNYEYYYNVEIESNYYYGIQSLGKNDLFCRTYAAALKDTTTNPITLTPELPPKNTCGYRTQRELRQEALIATKPIYFQIFDLNGTVLYDGVRPFRGFVLNDLNSNMILTGLRYTNRMVIYRYKIVS